MPWPSDRGVERGELADARAGLLDVVVVYPLWHVSLAVEAPHVECVEAVAAQCEAVLLAPECDLPWGVTGDVDDFEGSDWIPLAEGVLDLDWPAIPGETVKHPVNLSLRGW